MLSINGIFASVILVVVFNDCVLSQSCTSPDTCTSIYDCPPILSQITASVSPNQADYLRSLVCEPATGRSPHICCPVVTPPRAGFINATNGQGNILPSRGSCGVESFVEKLYNGNDTGLDEFPWMALLEYSKPNGLVRTINCGGVLINPRYVLTAAHCLTGEVETKAGQLVNIRLGEYDITTTTDCVDDLCADPVQNLEIEEVIPHPDYDEKNPNRRNDIGLVRLSQHISYSRFIQPICLPKIIAAGRTAPNSFVQVAGWGRTLDGPHSDKKQKLGIPIVDYETCHKKFAPIKAFIDDESQICAGGEFAEDTCDGDSGGPLMKFTNNYWTVEGIVSFGKACGLEGWPGVYTRVSHFEDWIESNMKP